jgi:hypothetical protein
VVAFGCGAAGVWSMPCWWPCSLCSDVGVGCSGNDLDGGLLLWRWFWWRWFLAFSVLVAVACGWFSGYLIL